MYYEHKIHLIIDFVKMLQISKNNCKSCFNLKNVTKYIYSVISLNYGNLCP